MGYEIEYDQERDAYRLWSTVSSCYALGGRWVKRPETVARHFEHGADDKAVFYFDDPDLRVDVPSVMYAYPAFGHTVPEGAKPATREDYNRYMRAVWVGSCLEVRARALRFGNGFWRQRGFEGKTADPSKVPEMG